MDNNMMNGTGDNIGLLLTDADNVCKNFGNYTFSSLLEKRIEFLNRAKAMNVQNQTFTNFDMAIYNQLLVLQQNEVAAYQARIGSAGFEELKVIREEINKKGYSTQAATDLNNQIAGKIINCQVEILNTKIAGYETKSRLDLRSLIDEIVNTGYDQNVVNSYVQKLNAQADVAEQKELAVICANVENADLTELAIITDKINAGGYKAEYAGRYITLINNRIDFIHTENMRRICENVVDGTREEVKEITKKIDEEECNQNLKTQFYGMINKRIEALDFEELTSLTENIDELDISELKELKKQIINGSYSQKFVKEFILKVRLQLEKLQFEDITSKEKNIDEMSRSELENAYKEICAKEYDDRVTAFEKEKIEDKIFELDMIKLTDLCNDFDMLNKESIAQVQMKIEQLDVSEKSKKMYLGRLDVRKLNLALEDIQPFAYMFNSLAQNFSFSSNSVKLATFSPDYLDQYKQLKANCTELKEYEVPVFIMVGTPYLAISREKVFCVLQDGLHTYGLEEIHSFNAVSKFLSSTLIINFRNGQSIQLPGNPGKNAVAFANMLNQFIQYLPNEPQNITPVKIHTNNYDVNEFKSHKKYEFSIASCNEKIISKYSDYTSKTGVNPLKFTNTSEWQSKEAKVRGNYGISVYEPVICYYDSSFFSGGKDGLAIGENFVFIKRVGVNTNIQIEKVYKVGVSPTGNKLQIEITDNNTFILDCISLDNDKITRLADILDDYIKSVQLAKVLNITTKKIVLEKEKLCTACNNPVAEGMIFCGKCGSKIEW